MKVLAMIGALLYWTFGGLLIVLLFSACCILHPIESAKALKAAVWD